MGRLRQTLRRISTLVAALYRIASFMIEVLGGTLLTMPIFALEIVALYVHGWSWQTVLLLPLAFLLSFLINGILTQNGIRMRDPSGGALLDLSSFLSKFQYTRFRLIENGPFLAGVLGAQEARQHFPEAFGKGSLRGSLMRGTLAHHGKLRIVSLEDDNQRDAHFPRSLVTFAGWSGAWVFIPAKTHNLSGLQKFQLLHELGHISGQAIARETATSSITLYASVVSLPFLLLRAQDHLIVALVLGFSMALQAWRARLARQRRSQHQLTDEIEADHFAFACSRPEWFKDYPAEHIAQRLCGSASLSPEEIQLRQQAFVSSLNALRAGQQPPKGPKIPGAPESWSEKIVFWSALAALLGAGAFYSPASGLHLLAAAICSFLALLGYAMAARLTDYMEALLTVNVGGVPRDDWTVDQVRSTKRSCLAISRRTQPPKIVVATYVLACNYIGQLYREEDAKATRHVGLAPGTSGTLFAPSQLDIFVKKTLPPQVWIFHGKEINLRLVRLDYHPQEHWVCVHSEDGSSLDLGVKIRWLIRPFWEDATEVIVARTEQGRVVEQVVLPLRTVTERTV